MVFISFLNAGNFKGRMVLYCVCYPGYHGAAQAEFDRASFTGTVVTMLDVGISRASATQISVVVDMTRTQVSQAPSCANFSA